ncbi:hypothetical protein AVEN_205157-1 [Araneus ventricosus]|uniref:Histone-lysine N-methyltransferase SETMAR n=1 Tax=Araneus ventricosus TaxID=182803 RepID=A0A4Y2TF83_ARAVE|nr:hypothetical protein AVEN_205157-1 [Araneus ventricosus]
MLTHEEGAVRSTTSTTDDIIQQTREMILENTQVTIDEVASAFNISHDSAHQIIHDELNFHKVCARWVPRKLTAENKLTRVKVSMHENTVLSDSALPANCDDSFRLISESLTSSDKRNRIIVRCRSFVQTSYGAAMVYLQEQENKWWN